MRKAILSILLFCMPLVLFAETPKKLLIDVQFNSIKSKSAYEENWNFKKTIKMLPTINQNTIVSTRSVLKNNFPNTLAMLVKAIEVKEEQITLQFNILQYGFEQSPTIISQPRIILKIGQSGEISTGPYRLKVSADWKNS